MMSNPQKSKRMRKLHIVLVSLIFLFSGLVVQGQTTVLTLAGGAEEEIGLPASAQDAFNIGRAAMMRVDSKGNIYWVDYYSNLGILKWDAATDEVSIFVKQGSEDKGDFGPVSQAEYSSRGMGIEIDCNDNVYWAYGAYVRMVDVSTNYVYPIAGNGSQDRLIDGALATETPLGGAAGLAFNDDCSVLYINGVNSGVGNQIYALDMNTGIINVIAGTGARDEQGFGELAILVPTREPFGLDYIKDGDTEWLYVATQQKRVYRQNLNTGVKELVAGNGGWGYGGDGGLAVDAMLKQPHDVLVSPDNTAVYFGDHQAHTVRKVDLLSGIIDMFAGNNSSDGEPLMGDGGPAVDARVARPIGVDWDLDGNLLFAERGNSNYESYIRKVDMETEIISTLIGDGTVPTPATSGVPSTSLSAVYLNAKAVLADDMGNFYVANEATHKIHKVNGDGVITDFAGSGETDFKGAEGASDTMTFSSFEAMLWDADGNMIIADDGHDVIYKLDMTTMMLSVLVGNGGSSGYGGDGGSATSDSAKINNPFGLAFNASKDTLYVVERGNHIVRMIDLVNDKIATFAGVPGSRANNEGEGDGGNALEAKFRDLTGVAVGPNGNVYIGQERSGWDEIRVVDKATNVITTFAKVGSDPEGMLFNGDILWVAANGSVKTFATDGTMTEVTDLTPASYNIGVSSDGVMVACQANGVLLIADEATALSKINDMAVADDASGLNPAMLVAAGGEKVMVDFIATYRDSVADADGVADVAALQTILDDANKAVVLGIIDGLAQADDASVMEIYHLELAQMANIIPENIAAYRDSVAAQEGIADAAALQTVVDNANAGSASVALAIIQAMAQDGTGDASELNYPLMVQAGVTGAIGGDMKYCMAYRTAVSGAPTIADLAALQALIDGANAAIALENIQMWADVNDATQLEVIHLEDAGTVAVTEDNLMAYKMAVEDSTAATLPDIAAIDQLITDVDAEMAGVAVIDAYAVAGDASAMTVEELEATGAMEVDADNLDQYKADVAAADGFTMKGEVQELVNAVNTWAMEMAAIVVIKGYADASDATAMTADELTNTGAMGVIADNLDAYKTAVAAVTGAEVDSTYKIQAIVDNVNDTQAESVLAVIDGFARANDAAALEAFHLVIVGVSDGMEAYIADYRTGVEAADSIPDVATLQAIVDDVNATKETEAELAAILAAIQGFADADDASGLALIHLDKIGADYNVNYLSFYQDAVADETAATLPDLDAVKALIATTNTEADAAVLADAIAQIDAMAQASDASTLSRSLLTTGLGGDSKLGKTMDHFDLYKAGVEGASGVADQAALQAIIDAANIQYAIMMIQSYADADDASAMTLQDLADAGAANIQICNLAAYQTSVAGADGADVATTELIQTLVDNVNTAEVDAALAAVTAMAGGDASGLTACHLDLIGVDYQGGLLEDYKVAIQAASALADAAAVQAVIDQVDCLDEIKDMPGSTNADDLTIEMLECAGVTGSHADLLQTYKEAVFDSTEIADLAGIQAIIDAVNAAAPVEVTFNVDMNALIDGGAFDPAEDFVDVAGSFNNWGDPVTQATDDDNDGIYTVVAEMPSGDIEFKFRVNGTWDPISEFPGGGPNRTYTVVFGETNEVNVEFNDGDVSPWVNVENMFGNAIRMYPNPTSGTVTLELTGVDAGMVDVNVTDVAGKTISVNKVVVNNSIMLDLTSQAGGIYYVKVKSERATVVRKLMVK